MSFDEAITATLQGFPDGTFAQLDLASPSTDLNVENRFDMGATVNVPGDSGADIALATWEGCLADGALAEYLVGSADNLGTAVQGRVTARLSDGSTEDASGCGGDVGAGQLFGAQGRGMTDAEVAESVDQALAGAGVKSQDVVVLRPLGPAIAVKVQVADAGHALDAAQRAATALDSAPYQYEGVFVEVVDSQGSPLVATGVALRAGTDNNWKSHLVLDAASP